MSDRPHILMNISKCHANQDRNQNEQMNERTSQVTCSPVVVVVVVVVVHFILQSLSIKILNMLYAYILYYVRHEMGRANIISNADYRL